MMTDDPKGDILRLGVLLETNSGCRSVD